MQVEKAARESEVCFFLSKLQFFFPLTMFDFTLTRHVHLISFCRLKLSGKYLVKTPVGKREKRK